MSIRISSCGWDLIGCGTDGAMDCSAWVGLGTVAQDAISEAAVQYLWNFTGRKYGVCEITVRPCREKCWQGSTYRGPGWAQRNLPWYGGYGGFLQPALISGEWFNLSPCGEGCSGPCACGRVEEVDLAGPVDSVTEVTINGEVLSPAAYRVDNHRWLVRTDGGRWPECQDMTADPETPGADTFTVSYMIGVPVPEAGKLAAGALACELAKAMCGDGRCKLPNRATRLSAQGVDVVIGTAEKMWTTGETGILLVDSFLASVNVRRRGGGRVASPDYRPTRRTTSG